MSRKRTSRKFALNVWMLYGFLAIQMAPVQAGDVGSDHRPAVAVFDFRDPHDPDRNAGVELQEHISSLLSSSQQVKVVARSQIVSKLDEETQMISDYGDAAEIGKRLNADYGVFGTVSSITVRRSSSSTRDYPARILFSLKVVKIQTSEIVRAADFDIDATGHKAPVDKKSSNVFVRHPELMNKLLRKAGVDAARTILQHSNPLRISKVHLDRRPIRLELNYGTDFIAPFSTMGVFQKHADNGEDALLGSIQVDRTFPSYSECVIVDDSRASDLTLVAEEIARDPRLAAEFIIDLHANRDEGGRLRWEDIPPPKPLWFTDKE